MFREVCELHYRQWLGRLVLGSHMAARVQLCPPPNNFQAVKEFAVVRRDLSYKY